MAASITSAPFGQLPDGSAAELFTLRNNQGLTATITNYGGIVTSLTTPDRTGELGDIVLGYDTLAGYLADGGTYFGALVGRYGNRIRQGRFELDGKAYQLATNNGPNHLHGGLRGFDKVLWQAHTENGPEGPCLFLRYVSPDGEEGYPGTLTVQVRYTLTNSNALRIEYEATTDQATPLNLTHHGYFNLSAGQHPDVLGHELTLYADRYTVVDDTLIPTGELRPVAGTAMDFTSAQAIGARIGQVAGGYDHNWVLARAAGPDTWADLALAADVYEPRSGRRMRVLTDQPGVQFYSGNFLDGSLQGKGGTRYGRHAGFCLETQHFPDSPNQPAFPSTILQPGHVFRSATEYRFGAA
ncbi:galactose mutarotase [Hymenobacter saemangeumensis]|uniref:Aldose 1-epimerase n=1 Tax=Hymenobacter saemangeumensis TaxID=1084522 RepID=A0ABP8IQK3_9BACT